MTFLALSTGGVLLLAGLTSALVLFLFFLKLRHRRFLVGSSLLWNRVLDERLANSLMEKLRRVFSLLLTLTIALLIAVALARPASQGSGETGPMILVMDTSPSMEARGPDGVTRWRRALDRARDLITSTDAAYGFMIADTSGQTQAPLRMDSAQALGDLESLHPVAGRQQFPSLPSGTTGTTGTYFFTDGVSALEVPESVTPVEVYQPADNVAITAFEVHVDPTSPSGYRAFLELTNYSLRARDVGLLLSGTGDEREARRVTLQPDEVWKADFDLASFVGGPLRARIEAEGDGLTLDDTAYAWLPPAHGLRVDLVTTRPAGYLATLLGLADRVDLRVVDPGSYTDEPDVDVYVFEGFVPATPPRGPAVIMGMSASEAPWLPPARGVASDQTITTWESTHPLMQFVPVYDLVIRETPVLDPAEWTVVAASETTPLVLTAESDPRRVLVAFDPEESDLPLHLSFPILMENALAWTAGEGLAISSGLGQVRLPVEATALSRLDGEAVPFTSRPGATVFEVSAPELLTAQVGGRRVRIAANLANGSESAVNRTAAGSEAEIRPPGSPGELWGAMLLAAALLMGVECWTYHRRVTV